MPGKKAKPAAPAGQPVSDYRHEDAKRKNNPPAGLAAHGSVRPAPKLRYAYDPHLPPVLRFDATARAEYLDDLIGRAIGGTLSEENAELLRELIGTGQPWLEWSGKREALDFVVDPVALHIHERVSTQAILSVLRRHTVHVVRERRGHQALPRERQRDARGVDRDPAAAPVLGHSRRSMGGY